MIGFSSVVLKRTKKKSVFTKFLGQLTYIYNNAPLAKSESEKYSMFKTLEK